MATLADVTTQWQTQAKTDLDAASAALKAAKVVADDAAKAVKEAQSVVAGLVTEETSLLASLDDAPSPADLVPVGRHGLPSERHFDQRMTQPTLRPARLVRAAA